MTIDAPSPSSPSPAIRQLRIVVAAEDYDEAVRFYRDVLGLPEELVVDSEGGASVTILAAGRATLEIANLAQQRMIDEVEVGRQVSGHIRVAFEVDDTEARTQNLVAAGAVELPTDPNSVAIAQLQARGAGRTADHAVPGARPRRAMWCVSRRRT